MPADASRPKPARQLDDVSLDHHTMWEQARVTGDLTGAVADEVEIHECVIEHARLTSARLEGVTIVDTTFDSCDLSGAALRDASLRRVELRGCRLSALDLSGSVLKDVTFEDCKLDWLNLRNTTGARVTIQGSDLTDASLYDAEMAGLDLLDCNLTRVEFSKARLSTVRLQGSMLEEIRSPLSVGGATIDSAQLVAMALALFAELGITIDDDRNEEHT